ncbi:RlpA-like double-psi beta-barrel-protein domain-containing protein-containing protein, partial [Absidia repens]
YNGIGTYYNVLGIGSCGESDSDDEMVVAVNQPQMENGANPNQNPECDEHVEIEGEQGKKVTARIVDTCPGCDRQNLDMSPKVFQAVCGSLSKGNCKIKWNF